MAEEGRSGNRGGGGGAARVRALPRREAPRPGHPPCPFCLTASPSPGSRFPSELRGRSRLRLGQRHSTTRVPVADIATTTAARATLGLSPRP